MSSLLLAPLGVIVFATIYWLAAGRGAVPENDDEKRCSGCGCQRVLGSGCAASTEQTKGD